jgi:hypothetical protein
MRLVSGLALLLLSAALFTASGLELVMAAFETWMGAFGLLVGVAGLTAAATVVLWPAAVTPAKRAGARLLLAAPLIAIAVCLWELKLLWAWPAVLVVALGVGWLWWVTTLGYAVFATQWAVAAAVVLIALAAVGPTLVGHVLKPLGALFILSGCWLLVLAAIQKRACMRRALAAAAIGFVLTSFFYRTHDMRVMADRRLIADTRSTICPNVSSFGGIAALSDILDCWTKTHADADGQATMVLVATAGGGSRAAQWTADVLARLDRLVPEFSSHVFAISSVSGGSLGSALYVGALQERADGRRCRADAGDSNLEPCLSDVLNNDGLAALISAWLSSDVITSILGPTSRLLKDRAAALESAWEASWNSAYHDQLLGQSFGSFYKQAPWPVLYVNATSVGQGGVASFGSAYGVAGEDFGSPLLRMSTVVGTSARFAFVSPAGSLTLPGVRDNEGNTFLLTSKASESDWAHSSLQYVDTFVDGGYADNFGDVTLRRLIAAIDEYQCKVVWNRDARERSIACAQLLRTRRFIRYVVIQISSDPTLEQLGCQDPPDAIGVPAAPAAAQLNFVVPFLTLENTRRYNGIIYATQMAGLVRDLYVADERSRVFGVFKPGDSPVNVPYFHFGLGMSPSRPSYLSGRPPSLNWTLADATRAHMAEHLKQCVDPSAPEIANILQAGMYYEGDRAMH